MKWIIFLILISCNKDEDMIFQAMLPSESDEILYPGTDNLKIWATGCWHTPKDVDLVSRYPYDVSKTQVEGVFDYDLVLALGDFESDQDFPTGGDTQTIAQVKTDIDAETNTGKIYPIAGNHDGGDDNMDWYKAAVWDYIDHSNQPFQKLGQKTNWEWERYYMKIGNVLIVMLSDRNDLPYPVGRGGSVVTGGHPSGAITKETLEWLEALIIANPDYNIITCHHNLPRETTVATGINEGNVYHGDSGIPEGRGALWSIFDEDIPSSSDGGSEFSDLLEAHDNVVAHFGAHTHAKVDVSHYGRGIMEIVDSVPYFNIGNLTTMHGTTYLMHPYSTFFEFANNNLSVTVKVYKHDTQDYPQGFYAPAQTTLALKYAYNPNYK